MAIHCLRPNDVGTDAENLFNVTNTEGKTFLENFESLINSLNSHWKGSDAVANIKDLITVYDSIADLIVNLQIYISTANNEHILAMQKELVASGGTCQIGNELSANPGIKAAIAQPTDNGEVRTEDEIKNDAETFDSYPTKFQTFIDNLNSYKNILLSNWLSGANREGVEKLFNEFNENTPTYKSNLEKVRNNINTVAANKSKLL